MCAFVRSGAGAVGFGVDNETAADERLLGRGVAVADGTGVSKPLTAVGAGDATTR